MIKKIKEECGPDCDCHKKKNSKLPSVEAKSNELKDIEELYEISLKLASSLNLNEILKIIGENITKITNTKFCDIYLLEKGIAQCAYSLGKRAPFALRYNVKDSINSKKALELQKPIEVTDIEAHRGYDKNLINFLKKEKICCLLYIPIIKDGNALGFVRLYRTGECGPTPSMKRIMTLVNQMAMAIENSRIHERLNKRKARWQAIFEDTSDGMIITDGELRILHANTAFEKIINKKARYLKGKKINAIFVNDEDRLTVEKELKDIQNRNQKIHHDILLESKDRVIWCSMNITFTDSSSFSEPRLIFSFEDITKNKELESSKSEFVNMVSHELRSPLTAVKGYLSLLKKEDFGKVSPKQLNFLNKVSYSTDRMVDLVESLLDVSRIETGKIRLIKEPVNIDRVFANVLRDLSDQLRQKNLTVKRDKERKKAYIYGDKTRIYQIFYNLLENAIKYSFPNGLIQTNLAITKNTALFSIKDNGVGIPSIEQKKLFTKFSRIDNVLSVSSGGTGLGLYIVKNLVSAHKGNIWVKSKENEGATFFVELPLAKQLSLIN